ncbi:MAG: hypothetical protein EBT08_20780, partial [Betaproteobacteria bacterium]|nr:hypothetical protein [Betaproteobacteria bacterium]
MGGRRLVWGDALDDGFLAGLGLFGFTVEVPAVFGRAFCHGVTGAVVRQPFIVMLEPLKTVMWSLKMLVRNQDDIDLNPSFELGDFGAFLVQE